MAIARSGNPEMSVEYGDIPILGEITSFKGRSLRVFSIESYYSNGSSFKDRTAEDAQMVLDILSNYIKAFPNRDIGKSQARVMDSLRHPKTLALLARYQGEVVGHGIFPRFVVEGENSRENYMYTSRAIQKDFEGDGLGMEMWRIASGIMHQRLTGRNRLIKGIIMMTQNAASIRSLELLRENGIMDGIIYPFERRWDKCRSAQTAMLTAYSQFRLRPRRLNIETGVSEGELEELGPNESFILREGTRTAEIDDIMHKRNLRDGGLGMKKKDVVWAGLIVEEPVVEDIFQGNKAA